MKKLFHLAGRAWAFLANEIQGEHFIIPHGGKVPEFLQDVTELQTKGELTYVIKDIEGCYPHMPKEIIRFAMRDMVEELKRVKQYEAVEVPGKRQRSVGGNVGGKRHGGGLCSRSRYFWILWNLHLIIRI
jgi:hypothetical protein